MSYDEIKAEFDACITDALRLQGVAEIMGYVECKVSTDSRTLGSFLLKESPLGAKWKVAFKDPSKTIGILIRDILTNLQWSAERVSDQYGSYYVYSRSELDIHDAEADLDPDDIEFLRRSFSTEEDYLAYILRKRTSR